MYIYIYIYIYTNIYKYMKICPRVILVYAVYLVMYDSGQVTPQVEESKAFDIFLSSVPPPRKANQPCVY